MSMLMGRWHQGRLDTWLGFKTRGKRFEVPLRRLAGNWGTVGLWLKLVDSNNAKGVAEIISW